MIKDQLTLPNNNTLSTFLPLRTKDKHYKFCWDTILGYFVHFLYEKSLVKSDQEDFKELCRRRFEEKLDEPAFWHIIDRMYFKNEQIFNISPELLIFKSVKGQIDTNSKKLGDTLVSILDGFTLSKSRINELNFLEKEIKSEFDSFYRSSAKRNENTYSSYLPFISSNFKVDLKFLNERPNYLLKNFNSVIRLYSFLYISQMALNIRDWASGEPASKPCFFILDNERASDERTHVKHYGYAQLHEYLEYLFPYLVMNENLQEKDQVLPIWQLYEGIKREDLEKLNQFGEKFVEDRITRKWYNTSQQWDYSLDKQEILRQLLDRSYAQFDKNTGRLSEYNQAAVKGMLRNILSPFIQRRGRAGQVLTLNQDYIVLLTNLAIGEREKLRFHEVVKEFESRGVFFDKYSQQSLIEFYERMGNVERMSDSGDAVYVRKTV